MNMENCAMGKFASICVRALIRGARNRRDQGREAYPGDFELLKLLGEAPNTKPWDGHANPPKRGQMLETFELLLKGPNNANTQDVADLRDFKKMFVYRENNGKFILIYPFDKHKVNDALKGMLAELDAKPVAAKAAAPAKKASAPKKAVKEQAEDDEWASAKPVAAPEVRKPSDLERLSGPELVSLYNKYATKAKTNSVKRFPDRATGLRRTTKLLQMVHAF